MIYERKQYQLAGKKIGFFGKGGAGKSTAVVLVAQALAEAGYTVCIVDADSTNIGLHQALGIAARKSRMTANRAQTCQVCEETVSINR
jgi:CO dehydrogenase nickel-insertion accessory protein CooC1